MNVQLNEQQRTEIRTTVINAHGAPRVSNVDFDVTVGTVVPRERIHVVPVPETLVRIEPEWRGFLYFVYEDEVVIVSPDELRSFRPEEPQPPIISRAAVSRPPQAQASGA